MLSLYCSSKVRYANCSVQPAQTSVSLEGSLPWHPVFVKRLQDNSRNLKKKLADDISKFHLRRHGCVAACSGHAEGHPWGGRDVLSAAEGFISVRTLRFWRSQNIAHFPFKLQPKTITVATRTFGQLTPRDQQSLWTTWHYKAGGLHPHPARCTVTQRDTRYLSHSHLLLTTHVTYA